MRYIIALMIALAVLYGIYRWWQSEFKIPKDEWVVKVEQFVADVFAGLYACLRFAASALSLAVGGPVLVLQKMKTCPQCRGTDFNSCVDQWGFTRLDCFVCKKSFFEA